MPPSTCDAMMDETLNRCCAWTGSHAYRTVHVEPGAIRPRCMDIAAQAFYVQAVHHKTVPNQATFIK